MVNAKTAADNCPISSRNWLKSSRGAVTAVTGDATVVDSTTRSASPASSLAVRAPGTAESTRRTPGGNRCTNISYRRESYSDLSPKSCSILRRSRLGFSSPKPSWLSSSRRRTFSDFWVRSTSAAHNAPYRSSAGGDNNKSLTSAATSGARDDTTTLNRDLEDVMRWFAK